MKQIFIRIAGLSWVRLALAGLLLVSGCERRGGDMPPASPGLRHVTLALNWFPEVEHGGFFAAEVHGYFQQEGLAVEIQSGGPGAPVIQQVATGRCAFAVANADQVLLGRQQGAPVVTVMAAMQNSPHCIMVHQRAGIDSLLKLRNVTLAVGSGKPFARYLLHKLGEAPLNIVPYQGSVAMFLERDDYAQQAYVFSEPFIARQQGGDPRCLMLSEIGFNPYASVLVVNEQLVARDPELVAKMTRACVRGWRRYLSEPHPTNLRIHEENAEMDLDVLAFGAQEIRELCLPGDMDPAQLGQMTAERWEELADQLQEIDLLQEPKVWQQAYDTRFLNEIQ
ncbi:MAG: ABC transporter substrate-binding protein [Pirellulaceae bacterium]